MVVCLQMIVWMVNGFWKCHYVTAESETGLIGAWRMLSKENDTEEVWSFQNEKDLYIAKMESFRNINGKIDRARLNYSDR